VPPGVRDTVGRDRERFGARHGPRTRHGDHFGPTRCSVRDIDVDRDREYGAGGQGLARPERLRPAVVTLDGSASSDVDGNLLTFAWTLVSKPANSAAVLSSLNSSKTSFTVDVAGDYVASLIVNDGQIASAPATATVTGTTGIAGQGTWETTLKPRDINGDGFVDAYYDMTLHITWLADADAAAGTPYDTSTADADGFITAADGLLYGEDARAWASSLNVHGVTGWRLPETDEIPPTPPQSSEMASMYYQTLGNSAAPSSTPGNTGPFSNLRATEYWTGTKAVTGLECWTFDFSSGRQSVAQCVFHFGPGRRAGRLGRARWRCTDRRSTALIEEPYGEGGIRSHVPLREHRLSRPGRRNSVRGGAARNVLLRDGLA